MARQKYTYEAAGEIFEGENVYAILQAPRGDATEAMVLCAAWESNEGVLNEGGVALVMALARYFKRMFHAQKLLIHVLMLLLLRLVRVVKRHHLPNHG